MASYILMAGKLGGRRDRGFLILLVCFLFFFTSGQLYFDGREVGGEKGQRIFGIT